MGCSSPSAIIWFSIGFYSSIQWFKGPAFSYHVHTSLSFLWSHITVPYNLCSKIQMYLCRNSIHSTNKSLLKISPLKSRQILKFLMKFNPHNPFAQLNQLLNYFISTILFFSSKQITNFSNISFLPMILNPIPN